MLAGPLRQEDDAGDHQGCKDGGGVGPAERQSSICDGLVEKVADRGPQRPGQDEGAPEQQRARDVCPDVCRRDDGQARRENKRAAQPAWLELSPRRS
jgi:hypothetical protein